MALFKKKLPAILKTFTKARDELDALIAANMAQVEANDVVINSIADNNRALVEENTAARKALNNLNSLIEG